MLSLAGQIKDFHGCTTCVYRVEGMCAKTGLVVNDEGPCHEHRYELCKACQSFLRPVELDGGEITLMCPDCGITRTIQEEES